MAGLHQGFGDQRSVRQVPKELLPELRSRVIHYVSEAKDFSAEIHQIAGRAPQLVLSLDKSAGNSTAQIAEETLQRTRGKRSRSGSNLSGSKLSKQSAGENPSTTTGVNTRSGSEGLVNIKTEPMAVDNGRVQDDPKKTRTILVQKIPPSVDEEIIELFFESTKKKGGGPVKQVKLVREKNWATVEFCEPEAVDVVMSKTPITMLDTVIDVKPYLPLLSKDEHLESLEIHGLPGKLTEDLLSAQVQSILSAESQDESRGEITYRCRLRDISNLQLNCSINSPDFIVRNLPWSILAKHNEKSLGFFLQCNIKSKSTTWSCNATAELGIIRQSTGRVEHVHKLQKEFFHRESDWGFKDFMPWHVSSKHKADKAMIREDMKAADQPLHTHRLVKFFC